MNRKQSCLNNAVLATAVIALMGMTACTTLPTPKVTHYQFPSKDAYLGEPERPHEKHGLVRTKVNWASLNPEYEEDSLCKNYFNKAAADLVKIAKKKGYDAVIHIQSVVFLMDGRVETHKTPECSDDGEEGQVLVQGTAITWVKPKENQEQNQGKVPVQP